MVCLLKGVTEAEIPSGPPIHVTVEAVSSTQLRVTWQAPDRIMWNGELTGYNIGYKKGRLVKIKYFWLCLKICCFDKFFITLFSFSQIGMAV